MPRPGEIDVKDFVRQKKAENEARIPIVDSKMKYLSTKEYAELLGKHPVTVANWLLAGKIEGALRVGRQWRIPVKT